jgi:chromate reductase
MNKIKVAVLVGSLRKESFSKKVALNLIKLASDELEFNFIDISKLPFFNQDLEEENNEPVEWQIFRDSIKSSDAILFVTPEYNRSIPPVLKNALDIGSRPHGQNVWNNKPAAIISVSPGAIGGFGANHHLRQVLTFLNVIVMNQPEAYIGAVHTLLDNNGEVNNERTKGFFKLIMDSYLTWVKRFL